MMPEKFHKIQKIGCMKGTVLKTQQLLQLGFPGLGAESVRLHLHQL